ncbi:MAG: flagellar biosynthesis protein FlgI [Acidocella sp. 20-57-95]|nr:MAG: flagellar biosynthesis protein FlgI [Acidocella sp. 20-57-95]OYV61236.1 MAG: flagellar biosynthesis protein FlgI [Acidocella sp. 21-58-7]HQT63575.1 flagellar basal body P-ring protein FlgI [Acidocella sp.]
MRNVVILALCLAFGFGRYAYSSATTIGALVTVAGAPSNQLYGYGLVVGLPGTGDQTTEVPYTQQSILNLLRNMGISLPNVNSMQPNNVASVMITAEIPAFSHAGQHLDVTVSAVGNATSLAGGVLLPTPLHGGNGQVYAQAQGPLLVSGFAVSAGGSTSSTNVPTVGSLPSGAIISNTIPASFEAGGASQLLLNSPDYQTAQQIADCINAAYGADTASAVSPGEVDLQNSGTSPVRFIAGILALPIIPADQAPTIIVDAQSGTIVMNAGVTLGPAVVSHGDLTVSIQTYNSASQPGPLSNGTTVGVQNTVSSAKQGKASVINLPRATTLADVARALNAVGASPSDLVAIVEALKQAGAINGVVKVI